MPTVLPSSAMENSPYKPVRALKRGIVLLQELNRLGSARPAELALAADIDRTTAYRLLATLEELSLVRRAGSSDEHELTEEVRTLSEGFTARDKMTQVVATHLGRLFSRVHWPSDFAIFADGAMVIRESTHRFSPYSVHRAMIGKPRPLFTSALGRAALAGASAASRATMIEIADGVGAWEGSSRARLNEQIDLLLTDYHRRGYGWSVGGTERGISAIAAPVRTASWGAAINIVFFTSAMTVETAASQFLTPLSECARSIEAELADIA